MRRTLHVSQWVAWLIATIWLIACSPLGIAPPLTITLAPTQRILIPTSTIPRPTPTALPARPTATLIPPTPTPIVIGYHSYRVQPNDTLESIGMRGGSSAWLLARYNRLLAQPQVGRELIIPQIAGTTSTITSTKLIVERGNTQRPWAALTFDCGGRNPHTHILLDTLRDAKIHATFFLLGESIIEDPQLLSRMVEEGHELANHSYTHRDFSTLTPAQIRAELDQTEAAVQNIVGNEFSTRPYVRFPYGAYSEESLQTAVAHGYMPVHWTLDVHDTIGDKRSAKDIAERVIATLTLQEAPGAIILGHCVDATIDAMPDIISALQARGVELHTLTDVLGL